jgi:hypothetical protein
MSMGQPKTTLALKRRREQREVMANSAALSPMPAIRVRFVLPTASGKHTQQIASQARLFEINRASPISICTPEIPVFGSSAA